MAKERFLEPVSLGWGQGHPPVRRISNDKIEGADFVGSEFQCIAGSNEVLQWPPGGQRQAEKRQIEQHHGHPSRKGVDLNPKETRFEVIQNRRRLLVTGVPRKHRSDGRQERCATASGVYDSSFLPVEAGQCNEFHEPLHQGGRGIEGAQFLSDRVRKEGGVKLANKEPGLSKREGYECGAQSLDQAHVLHDRGTDWRAYVPSSHL